MKVCLIASNCIEVSPYIEKYKDILKNNNIEYEVIEKRHIEDNYTGAEESIHTFFYNNTKTNFGKIVRFIKYAIFVRRKIKECKYDKFVLFSAVNSAICYVFIRKYIKGKYIVDIRDYDIAIKIPMINYLYNNVLRESNFIIVSSEKFKTWMPANEKTYVMHNLPSIEEETETKVFENTGITIAYLGSIAYYQQNIKLVESLKYYNNILIKYYGRYPAAPNIKQYCEERCYDNVVFGGSFRNCEKNILYNGVDFINAIYGNDSLVVTSALPNKLYDCLYYKIPIIVSKGTYLGELVKKYELGIVLDVDNDDIHRCINEYINEFNKAYFVDNCEKLLSIVKTEQNKTEKKILSFIQGEIHEN